MRMRAAHIMVAIVSVVGTAMTSAPVAQSVMAAGQIANGETQQAEEGTKRPRRPEPPPPSRVQEAPRPGIPIGEEQLRELKRRARGEREPPSR